jgi:hypothetical protein
MKIKLNDGILEVSFYKGKPVKILLWLSKEWIDLKKEIRGFLKSQGNFIASRQSQGGLFEVESKKKLTSLDIFKFACWLEKRGNASKN